MQVPGFPLKVGILVMPSFHRTSPLNFFRSRALFQDIWALKYNFSLIISYFFFPSAADPEKIIRGLIVYLGGNPLVDGEERQRRTGG